MKASIHHDFDSLKKINGKPINNLQNIRSFAIMSLRKMTPSSNPLKKTLRCCTKKYPTAPSNTKQHQATPSNTKQHQATPSNTKQHQATPSNTKQHQATPSNTKQVDVPVFEEQLQGMKLQSIVERGY
ncbi:hypothetical protein [Anoxynatronum buryatiense]|uniref:hypothetical protein n=1 Tax=Anoxynatronum buryatiense TaxID=489973 RepID=UPI0024B86A98|nr:hypothetical protein [Anoxynatronum buryatiense]